MTIQVNNFDTIEEWRLKTNEMGVKIADLDNNLFTINVIASGNITVSGNLTSGGNLVVSGNASVGGNISGSSNLVIAGYSSVTGNISTASNVIVSRDAIVTGNVSTSGNVVVSQDARVTGNIFTTSNLIASKDLVVSGNGFITGNVTAANVNATINYKTYVANKPSINVIFKGNILGVANLALTNENTNIIDVSANVAADSVTLGTHTVGDYVKTITGSAGNITIGTGTGEGSTPIVDLIMTAVTPGTYANANAVSQITVTKDGRLTSATNVLIDRNYGLTTNKPSINIRFTGNIVANANLTLSSEGTNILTVTDGNVGVNSVTLGTHTVGDYVKSISGSTGNITIGTGTGEGSTPTVDLIMTAVSPGNYGNANAVANITVTQDGRLVKAENILIDRNYGLTTKKPSVNLNFIGDVTGKANVNLANENTNALDVTLIVAANSVELGTDTTGNYTNRVVGGTGITATGAIDEGNVITVGLATVAGLTVGTYGNANAVSQVTVDSTGRVTSASNLLIDRNYGLTSKKPSVNLKFTGDVTGTANLNLANENTNLLDVEMTIAADSIVLGTDTTGNYTDRVVGGTGITATGSINEGNVITVGLATVAGLTTGTYGNANAVSQVTVDSTGRVTSASNLLIDRNYGLITNKPAINVRFVGNIIGNANLTLSNENTNNLVISANLNNVFTGTPGQTYGSDTKAISIKIDPSGRIETISEATISIAPQLGNYVKEVGGSANIVVTNGSGQGLLANVDLTMTNVDPGVYGNANAVPQITVTRDGRLVNAGNLLINRTYGLTTNKPSVNLKFTGDVTGTANINLANENTNLLDVAMTIAADSIALGTDTTGNYVKSIAGASTSANIVVQNGSTEGGDATIDLAITAVSPGTYGNGTCVGTFTVDKAGRLTCACNTAITFPAAPTVTQQFGKTNETIFSCTQTSVGSLSTSNPNFIVGPGSGFAITSGGFNTILGACAGNLITSGSRNFLVGTCAGGNITTGSDNIIFGCVTGNVGLTASTSNVIIMAAGGLVRQKVDDNDNFSVGRCAGYYITGGVFNNFIGRFAGFRTAGGNLNNFIGACAGVCNISGQLNNFMGRGAGSLNTTGSCNNFFGEYAGCPNTSGRRNIYLGNFSGGNVTTGNDNIIFGCLTSCVGLTAATSNVIIMATGGLRRVRFDFTNNILGNYAGNVNSSSYNNFIGVSAGRYNTSGRDNNFLGFASGYCNTTGSYNNFFGPNSGGCNTSGSQNNFFGRTAGFCNTTGCYNNFFGCNAGRYNTSGSQNNFFGRWAGVNNTTGSRNIYLGAFSGGNVTTGNDNIIFGCLTSCAGLSSNTSNVIIMATGGTPTLTINSSSIRIGRSQTQLNSVGVIAIGALAGAGLTTGVENIFIGISAGELETTGIRNTFIGNEAGIDQKRGRENTFLGAWAGLKSSNQGAYSSNCNTYVGALAGYYSSKGLRNTFLGAWAGRYAGPSACSTTPSDNVLVGFQAAGTYNNYFQGCKNVIIGANAAISVGYVDDNVIVGHEAGLCFTQGNNNIFLGTQAGCSFACTTTQSNRIVIGNTSHTNFYTKMASKAWACTTVKWDATSYEMAADTSSRRFKTDIRPFFSTVKDVEQIESVRYKPIEDPEANDQVGFIAEQMDELGMKEFIAYDSNNTPFSVSYDRMAALFVNAIKELSAEVKTLKAEIAELKKRV
jgi:cytoskeletal protein CcmA (bactofilin family)